MPEIEQVFTVIYMVYVSYLGVVGVYCAVVIYKVVKFRLYVIVILFLAAFLVYGLKALQAKSGVILPFL